MSLLWCAIAYFHFLCLYRLNLGCLACIEASPCWRAAAVGLSGYVPVREKALVHPSLDYTGGAGCGACLSTLRAGVLQCVACVSQALLLLWQVLAAALHIIGELPSLCVSCASCNLPSLLCEQVFQLL